jgi:hypothetical protein
MILKKNTYDVYESSVNVNQEVNNKTEEDVKMNLVENENIKAHPKLDADNKNGEISDQFKKEYTKTYKKYLESIIKNKKSSEYLEEYFRKTYPDNIEDNSKTGALFPIGRESAAKIKFLNKHN